MKRIRLPPAMTARYMDNFTQRGERRVPDDAFPWDVYGGKDLTLERHDGSPLAVLLVGVIPLAACWYARLALRRAATFNDHRGGHYSGTVGNYRHHGQPGPAAFTRNRPEQWGQLSVLLREMDAAYRRRLPDLYAERRQVLGDSPWLVPGTTFTTGTCNNAADFHGHADHHNIPGLLDAATVVRVGTYAGGCLAFIRYQAALDLHAGDLLVADFAGETHCNTPIIGEPGQYERLSIIAFARHDLIAGEG
jgi:hypothetical protein